LLVENEARGPHRHRLPLAAYDNLLICSHTFNMLQASGAISVAERAGYLKRVRDLAVKLAKTWTEMEEDRKLDHAAHQEQRRAEVSRG
jgi:glycyl-tRNA synthetase alpha chain